MHEKSRQRHSMTQVRINHVIKLIEEMPFSVRPSWDDIALTVEKEIGIKWPRQTLESKSSIKEAYLRKKMEWKEFTTNGNLPKNISPEVSLQNQKLIQKKNEDIQLQATLEMQRELIQRYLLNAIRHGLTQEQMEAPLVPPDRAQSDPKGRK